MGKRVSVEYARAKLSEWCPSWNVDAWEDNKVMAVYQRERNKTVSLILEAYGPKRTV